MSQTTTSLQVSNPELATVREAMRELHHLLAALDQGQIEKVVLCQKNQMRAVLITLERYSQLERHAAPPPAHQHHTDPSSAPAHTRPAA